MTALDFLYEIMFEKEGRINFVEFQQAKEMEKEQSMNDFMAGKWDWAEHIKGKESKDPAEYYNETYKTQA